MAKARSEPAAAFASMPRHHSCRAFLTRNFRYIGYIIQQFPQTEDLGTTRLTWFQRGQNEVKTPADVFVLSTGKEREHPQRCRQIFLHDAPSQTGHQPRSSFASQTYVSNKEKTAEVASLQLSRFAQISAPHLRP